MLLSDRDFKAAIITILSKVKETLTMNGKTRGKCHYTSVQTYRTFSINMNLNVNYRFWVIGSSVVGKKQQQRFHSGKGMLIMGETMYVRVRRYI